MPLDYLAVGLAAALALAFACWFFVGAQMNVRRLHSGLRWLRDGLPLLGARTSMSWGGTNRVTLRMSNAADPYSSADIVLQMEPRDVIPLWWLAHARGQRDSFAFRGILRRHVRVEFHLLDEKSWSGRRALKSATPATWSRTPLSGGLVLVSERAESGAAAKRLLARLGPLAAYVSRISVRRAEPNIEVHMAPPWEGSMTSPEIVQMLKDIGQLRCHRSALMMNIPNLGQFGPDAGLISLAASSDGAFVAGSDGVRSITATGDRKVEFIAFANHTLALVNSALGYPAYYPVHDVSIERPVKAVLTDLDGTSVRSEGFWVWIIQLTIATLLGQRGFTLDASDTPFVSGHSVSEHLQYCIGKYCPHKRVEEARRIYFEHTQREMQAILAGRGRADAFTPAPGLKDFLLALKARGVKIGLVTSGLYEKAYPEILAAFRTMGMGDPRQFYDAIISAGFPLRPGEVGTLGELSPKPHPWLYAEVARVGLGIAPEERYRVIGIEDSGAGVCSIRLAGFSCAGMSGGNIVESGTKALCSVYVDSFAEILEWLG